MKSKSPKQLQPDQSYSSRGQSICEYDAYGAQRAAAFRKDAVALLREAGQWLKTQGLNEAHIKGYVGGVFDGGSVFADYWSSFDPTRRLTVQIACTDQFLGGRRDGIYIRACTAEYREEHPSPGRGVKPVWRETSSGPNQWLSPAMNSTQLGERLWTIFSPTTSPTAVCVHTPDRPAPLPISTFASTEAEAVQNQHDLLVAFTALRAAQVAVAAPVQPVLIPIALRDFNNLDDRLD